MSRATACVRFPSGKVLWTIYNGTTDILMPSLHDSQDDAWENYCMDSACKCRRPHKVQIYSDYGGGFWWEGLACEPCKTVLGPLEPWDDTRALAGLPQNTGIEVHHEKPSWVTI